MKKFLSLVFVVITLFSVMTLSGCGESIEEKISRLESSISQWEQELSEAEEWLKSSKKAYNNAMDIYLDVSNNNLRDTETFKNLHDKANEVKLLIVEKEKEIESLKENIKSAKEELNDLKN